MWNCVCDCGAITIVQGIDLRNGHTRSCGCYKAQLAKERATTHGKINTPEYNVWQSMKKRCTNPNNKDFHNYGGRGIKVCDRWLESFEKFYSDMGPRPSKDHSIDRINNNGNYTPENTKWSSPTEQANNKRVTVFLTYKGVTLSRTQWTRKNGLGKNTISDRLKRGWSVERALTEPVKS